MTDIRLVKGKVRGRKENPQIAPGWFVTVPAILEPSNEASCRYPEMGGGTSPVREGMPVGRTTS